MNLTMETVLNRSGRNKSSASTLNFVSRAEALGRVAEDTSKLGGDMMDFMRRLWPICRCLAGPSIRETFDIIGEHVPLTKYRFNSGDEIFDWTVPKEWTIREAYIRGPSGEKIIDFNDNNLHVVSYSLPVHERMTLDQLRPHLYTVPSLPDAIPYITSYYKETWGFCLTHRQMEALPAEGEYEVFIDSTLENGTLELREGVVGPEAAPEVLFSTYCCHPSMANNELSGPVIQTFLYRCLSSLPALGRRYRFVFLPETIGALAYLSQKGEHLREHLVAGYEITCCGDHGPVNYKKSRRGDSLADRAAAHVLKHCAPAGKDVFVHEYFPDAGANERQYNSPGFNLPVGSLMRSEYGRYPEYHTSLDNLDFVSAKGMASTLSMYLRLVQVIEMDVRLINLSPYGEPQLGKHGLYVSAGIHPKFDDELRDMLYVLNYSDGEHSLVDIADRLGAPVWRLLPTVARLAKAGLVTLAAPA
jgi:aminopeptidase-like protein